MHFHPDHHLDLHLHHQFIMGMIFILFVTIDGLEVDVKMLKPYLHPKPVDAVDGRKHT